MRVCTNCLTSKNEDEYYFKNRADHRLHAICKQCYAERRKLTFKIHYEKYGDEYRKRALVRKHVIKSIRRKQLLKYLTGKSCVTCGNKDIRVLDFDHINKNAKSFGIARALNDGISWENILAEINKCQILCANCHRIRTSKQFNWYREPTD